MLEPANPAGVTIALASMERSGHYLAKRSVPRELVVVPLRVGLRYKDQPAGNELPEDLPRLATTA